MRYLLLLLFLVTLSDASIKVAAAANISYALPPLIEEFNKKYPTIKVDVIIGSSGKLTAQIISGAPFDLFLSADMKYPQTLFEKGLAVAAPEIYAVGSLILFSKEALDLKGGVEILKEAKIRHIAIANMTLAPYGKAAAQALKKSGIFDQLQPKFIQGESVAQTVQYTLNAADIGFIPKSALYAKAMEKYKAQGSWIEVDSRLYRPIEQGAVLLKRSQSEGKAFYDFIFSAAAQKIFQKYGYAPAGRTGI